MSPTWPNNSRTSGTEGFTLVELLVAVAITVTMLAAILSVFFAVIQTVTRGHNTQKGFELARGTMNVIERDLAVGFSARDIGDADKFFGAPMGMSFIVKNDSVHEGQPNKYARVTYVVYFPSRLTGQVEVESTENSGEFINVTTYSLLRYVEPGISELDSYPVDWLSLAGSAETSVNAELSAALNANYVNAFSAVRSPNSGGQFLPQYNISEDELTALRAKKRELWLRMLAGHIGVPNAWDILDLQARERLANQGTPASGRVVLWEDYVVAENVAYQPSENALDFPLIDPSNPLTLDPTFFTYGAVLPYRNMTNAQTMLQMLQTRKPIYVALPYWNSVYNANGQLQRAMLPEQFIRDQFAVQQIPLSDQAAEQTMVDLAWTVQLGSPLKPSMPELVGVRMGYQLESPFAGVPEFQEVFGQVIDLPSAYSRKQMSGAES
jgi:hypothetical protein